MSQIRKAHSVEIIDRRLRDCEVGGNADVMELVGLHDELARVERKWVEKFAGVGRPATGRVRPPANVEQLNARFERLTRLVEAALRKPGDASPERKLLEKAGDALKVRKPLSVDGAE